MNHLSKTLDYQVKQNGNIQQGEAWITTLTHGEVHMRGIPEGVFWATLSQLEEDIWKMVALIL